MPILTCPECKARFNTTVAAGVDVVKCPRCLAPVFAAEREAKPAPVPPPPPAPKVEPRPPVAAAVPLPLATARPAVAQPVRPPAEVEPARRPHTGVVIGAAVGGAVLAAAVGVIVLVRAPSTAPADPTDPLSDPTERLAARTGETVTPSPLTATDDSLEEWAARLQSPDPKVKGEAVHQLAQLRGEARPAVPAILMAMPGLDRATESAFAQALEQIGPPSPADQAVLVRAVQSPSAAARRYALGQYAKSVTAPRAAVPKLAALLDDPSAPVRVEAVRALQRVGSDCRAEAYRQLVDRLGDDDPTVAAAAGDLLKSFGVPSAAELELLWVQLTHPRPEVRRFAARTLVDHSNGPRDGVTLWKSLREEPDRALRETALDGLTKWRAGIREVAPDMLTWLKDSDPAIRARTAGLVAEFAREPGVMGALIRLAEADAAPAVRDAATAALARRELNRPADLPALRLLLRHESADYQTTAARRIAALGADGSAATDDLLTALSRGSAESRAAVIQALSAIGPQATAKAVEPLGRMLARPPAATAGLPPADGDQRAAVAALATMGEPGLRQLLLALKRNRLSVVVTAEVCRALGAFGVKAEPAVVDLVRLAEQPAQRPAAGEALVAIGGDLVIDELIKITNLNYVVQNRTKVDVVPSDFRHWAIDALGQLDRTRLTEKQFTRVTGRLDFVLARERDRENKAAAVRALARLSGTSR